MRVSCFCGLEFNCEPWTNAQCPTCGVPVDPFEPDAAEPERLVNPSQARELREHFEAS